MENKNLIIIICVAIVICAIIGFGIFALTSTQTESVISADIPLVSPQAGHPCRSC